MIANITLSETRTNSSNKFWNHIVSSAVAILAQSHIKNCLPTEFGILQESWAYPGDLAVIRRQRTPRELSLSSKSWRSCWRRRQRLPDTPAMPPKKKLGQPPQWLCHPSSLKRRDWSDRSRSFECSPSPSSSSSWFVDLLAHWIPFRQVACHPIISGPRDAVQPMFCPVLSMPWQGPVAAIDGTRYVHWHVAAKVYQQLADCCMDHRSKIFCICKRFCNAWERLHSRLERKRTLGTWNGLISSVWICWQRHPRHVNCGAPEATLFTLDLTAWVLQILRSNTSRSAFGKATCG